MVKIKKRDFGVMFGLFGALGLAVALVGCDAGRTTVSSASKAAASAKVEKKVDTSWKKDYVKASSFGWTPTNAVECFRKAMASGAKKILVDKQASEWLIDTTSIPSDTEVVFEDGVVVRAIPGSMKKTTACLISVKNVTNVVLRGEGKAILKMNVADYLDPTKYQHSEHRHCVSLHRAQNVVVRDLTLQDSGGDGIYVLVVKHALIENCVCSGHARQGSSIISADDVTIRNCVFERTKGALPECGMDIEPGHKRFHVGHVQIENCVMRNNNCSGVAVNVSGLAETSGKMDVTYKNCKFIDNEMRGLWCVLARGTWAPVKGDLRFIGCEMRGNKSGPVQINNLGSDALHLLFKDCIFDYASTRDGGVPFQIVNGALQEDLNNLTLENCKLLNAPVGKPAVTFTGMTGVGVLPGGAKGKLDITYADGTTGVFDFGELEKKHVPKPELRQFETAAIDFSRLMPANLNGTAKRQKVGNYRGGFTFLQYIQKPGEYKIHFSSSKIGKYANVNIPVQVFDIAGTPHDKFVITTPEFDYTLKAQSRNSIYRFDVTHSGRLVRISSETPGHGIVANSRVHWLTANKQSIYFYAKPGAEKVQVELKMSPSEPVTAALVDSTGKVCDSCTKSRAGVILTAMRPKTAAGEIFELRIDKFVDDCHLRLGAGTSGVYAYDPAMVLIEKK